MANNYQQFSISIDDLTDEEHAWLTKLLAALGNAPEMMDPTGESNEDLVAEWAKFTELVGAELSEIVLAVAYDNSGDKGYWGQSCIVQDSWWLCEEEGCNLDIVTALIQAFFRRWRPAATCILSWADTCSKMRVDEFGGGACLITADWVYWPPFQLDAMAELYNAAKKAGKSMSAEEALAAIEERVEP